mmetsp:Transcript_71649/g.167787  ORF Transcript_71649/g.167787 Transcript_71649/m.167787 type:complete len:267 (+) Transcript_71649:456-1256(+)
MSVISNLPIVVHSVDLLGTEETTCMLEPLFVFLVLLPLHLVQLLLGDFMFLAQFEHFKLPDAADVHLRQTNLHLSSHSRLPLRVELDRLLLREKTGHHCFIVLDGLAPAYLLGPLLHVVENQFWIYFAAIYQAFPLLQMLFLNHAIAHSRSFDQLLGRSSLAAQLVLQHLHLLRELQVLHMVGSRRLCTHHLGHDLIGLANLHEHKGTLDVRVMLLWRQVTKQVHQLASLQLCQPNGAQVSCGLRILGLLWRLRNIFGCRCFALFV